MKKYTYLALLVAGTSLLLASCGIAGGNDPGIEYAPDMYVSKAYEPFSQTEETKYPYNEYGMSMRKPPVGTIARGQLAYAYPYANTNEGYEAAKANLKNPVPRSEEALATGKHLYNIHCAVCHGVDGKADGELIKAKKFPPPPSYETERIRTLSEGGMYHSITYGKNLMGSYASSLTPEERWKVVHYIQYLSGSSTPVAPAADMTAAATSSTPNTNN